MTLAEAPDAGAGAKLSLALWAFAGPLSLGREVLMEGSMTIKTGPAR
jgi:hypothetical protein